MEDGHEGRKKLYRLASREEGENNGEARFHSPTMPKREFGLSKRSLFSSSLTPYRVGAVMKTSGASPGGAA